MPAYTLVEPVGKPAEPGRSQGKKVHITDTPITKRNWYKHVNWLHTFFLIGVPTYGLIAALWTTLQWKTLLWAVVYYYWTGLGITAGEQQKRSKPYERS